MTPSARNTATVRPPHLKWTSEAAVFTLSGEKNWELAEVQAPSGWESRLSAMRSLLTLGALLVVLCAPAREAAADPVLSGRVSRVVDGDTLDLAIDSGSIRVRLHAIDAPESNQPGGLQARQLLSRLVLGRQVAVEPVSQDRYERLVGVVHLDDVNVNREMVSSGHAWAARRYMKRSDRGLCLQESDARSRALGLWTAAAVAPWDWRRGVRRNPSSAPTAETCLRAIGKR